MLGRVYLRAGLGAPLGAGGAGEIGSSYSFLKSRGLRLQVTLLEILIAS